MRITSVTLLRYRRHKDITVELDPNRNVIGGDNEAGKSTIVEAIHRVLFLNAKGVTDLHTSMRSDLHGTPPEVRISFDARGRSFSLKKVFSGPRGSTTLVEIGGGTWRDSEADEKLSEILGVEAAGTGKSAANRCLEQWGHLWVWQGSAPKHPGATAAGQIGNLLSRLQETGGAAMLQSEKDAEVAALVRKRRDEVLTQTGAIKAGSDLSKAITSAKEAREELEKAKSALYALDDAIAEHESANEAIVRCDRALEESKEDLEGIEKRLIDAGELKASAEKEERELAAVTSSESQLGEADERIAAVREAIAKSALSLSGKEKEIETLEAMLVIRRQDAKRAEERHREALAQSHTARLRRDLASAHLAVFERRAQLVPLAERRSKVLALRRRHAELAEEIVKLPEIAAKDLEALKRLETEMSNAQSALDAMATAIEVLVADTPVSADGAMLAKGEEHVITDETEIAVGANVRLRIRPGGGEGLFATRKKLTDAKSALGTHLTALGAKNVEEASSVLERRRSLAEKQRLAEAELAGLRADTLERETADAEAAAKAAEAEALRRAETLADLPTPATERDARSLLADLSRECDEAERSVAGKKEALDAASEAAASALFALEQQRQAISLERTAQDQRRGEIKALLATHGEDEDRAKRRDDLAQRRREISERLSGIADMLSLLAPDDLERAKAARMRAIEIASKEKSEAEKRRAAANAKLQMDGVSDPRHAAVLAEAKAGYAEEEERRFRAQVDALALLSEIFAEEQHEAADRLTRPLVEKVQGYVRRIFGPSASVKLEASADGVTGLSLARPEFGHGAFEFDSLSTGAREQLAAAFRLATAEVLAEDHERSLPIVFDDAFVNSDAERTKKLLGMLDLAASRGLQIIIVTKEPADYATLGAKTVILPKPERGRENPPTVRAEDKESAAS